VIDTNICMADT